MATDSPNKINKPHAKPSCDACCLAHHDLNTVKPYLQPAHRRTKECSPVDDRGHWHSSFKQRGIQSTCSRNGVQLDLTDTDILNFALNFEYLDAEFYSYATTGAGLPSNLLGDNPGATTGGQKANLSEPIQVHGPGLAEFLMCILACRRTQGVNLK